jgi:hypothetical protein
MTDSDERIRAALGDEKPRPGELHDANIRSAMRDVGAQLAATEPARKRRNFVPLGLAAGLLMAVGAAIFMRLSVQGHRDVEDATRGVTTLPASLEPAPGAELDAPPTRFRWPAQAGATAYVVTLRDGSGTLIWRSEPVTSADTTLPPLLAMQVSAGRAYLWSVEVSGQADVNELGPWAFRLR